MTPETADTIAAVASKTTVVGAGASALGWLSFNEALALGGFVVALIGLGVNWYYRALANRREQSRHDIEMRQIKELIDSRRGES